MRTKSIKKQNRPAATERLVRTSLNLFHLFNGLRASGSVADVALSGEGGIRTRGRGIPPTTT